MITINTVAIPTPSTYSVGIMDLTKSWRANNGLMNMEYVASKRKVECTWLYMSNSELSSFLQLIQGASNMFFTLAYPDPQTNSIRSGLFYVGDRTVGSMDYISSAIRWKNITCNFIEQ